MPVNKIVIRQAKIKDWPEYKKLRISSILEAPSAFPHSVAEIKKITDAEWEKLLSEKNRKMFFVFVDGNMIGILGATFFTQEKLRHRAHLISFYISSNYQGLGIGTKLMKFVLEFLKKRKGIIKIDSSVNEGREASLKIHLKEGFKIIGKAKKEMKIGGKFYDQYLLEKILK